MKAYVLEYKGINERGEVGIYETVMRAESWEEAERLKPCNTEVTGEALEEHHIDTGFVVRYDTN